MKDYNLLESYRDNSINQPNELDKVAKIFKKFVIKHIENKFVNENITDEKIKMRFVKNLNSYIKEEYNTLEIKYYEILENLNLCIEVEMSNQQVIQESNLKFAETKFSEIMINGLNSPTPINRFALSEKLFVNYIKNIVETYTQDFIIDEETIKIEFN